MPFIATKPPRQRNRRFLRPIQLRPAQVDASAASQDQSADDEQQGLLCSTCRSLITHEDQAISINGRHQHAFFNPAGIAFEIRCFQRAPGVRPQGTTSIEFSWFAGHTWQIVLCATCHTHLGWQFVGQAGSSEFYGLIASRLSSS